MDTKLKSDIAESAVATQLLRRGFKTLKPFGDRLPYDLAVDVKGHLIRIQVKYAWKRKSVHIVDNRRTKTNRRRMLRTSYCVSDFDFAIIYIEDLNLYYVMPVSAFCTYRSEITLSAKAPSNRYLERWDLIQKN